ncbi:hypothetical protein G7Y89_g9035 [Cudoniella acicularis]|uniref:Uncharacterized protein n=1 Tax=Cudoniella acicularis TaxID=354080 RepID=A0A8H4W2A7_9HELO|nr:hypothetical protein G7Y89_g9035 [Cudoniella acicularis]
MSGPPQPCDHSFEPQLRYGTLPPLYFAPNGSISLPLSTLKRLEQSYRDMGNPQYRSPFVMITVNSMKKELDGGMTRERREVLKNWVEEMRTRERTVVEVFLARYKGFKMGGDGRLDYGLGEEDDIAAVAEPPATWKGWRENLHKLRGIEAATFEVYNCTTAQRQLYHVTRKGDLQSRASMSNPHLPPLSNSKTFKFRRSRSTTYDNSSPEWYWKLSPILPELWVRDSNLLTPDIISELEAAWLYYQRLNIPGKGDGASWKVKTREGRRKLERQYMALEDEVRRAKEVNLARFDEFVIRGEDGSLDYHTEVAERECGDSKDKKCVVSTLYSIVLFRLEPVAKDQEKSGIRMVQGYFNGGTYEFALDGAPYNAPCANPNVTFGLFPNSQHEFTLNVTHIYGNCGTPDSPTPCVDNGTWSFSWDDVRGQEQDVQNNFGQSGAFASGGFNMYPTREIASSKCEFC